MHLIDVGEPEHRVPVVNTPVSRFGDHEIAIILTISAVMSVRPDMPRYYFELGYSLLLSHPFQCVLTQHYICPHYVISELRMSLRKS